MPACTVTSSAVVGSSATSSSGSHPVAIAIIARWSWPPDSSWGYDAAIRSGSSRPTEASSPSTVARPPSRARPCACRASSICRPMRCTGFQRGHRLLEDRADPGPPDGPDRRTVQGEQVVVAEQDPPAHLHLGPVQPQHRLGGHRLAGAGLADQGEHAAAPYVEVDAVHDLPRAAPPVGERDGEPADAQEGVVGHLPSETRR